MHIENDNSIMRHEFIVELSNAKLCGARIPYIYIYICSMAMETTNYVVL
jgi:hypothetical protein